MILRMERRLKPAIEFQSKVSRISVTDTRGPPPCVTVPDYHEPAQLYSLSSLSTLPCRSLALSSSLRGMLGIQSVPGLFSTNG